MIIDCEAWFLSKRPSGDTSVQVSLFTKDTGLVNCLYKGGRNPKKQGVLQSFMPLWLALDHRADWYYIRKLESSGPALFFKDISLYAGLYINELIFYALKPYDAYPQLYETYQYTLKALSTTTDQLVIEALLRQFELVLLNECGYTLEFSESGQPIQAAGFYRYVAGKGFQLADKGLAGGDILGMSAGQFDQITVLKSAKLIMRAAITHLLDGQELKSRSLFLKIKNA